MTDPLVLNGAMPSEEYARYAAFWIMQIRFVLVVGVVTIVSAILANAAATYWAVRRALRHGRND